MPHQTLDKAIHFVDFGDLGVLLFNVMNLGLEDCRTWIIFVLTFIYSIFRVYNEYTKFKKNRNNEETTSTKTNRRRV